MWYTGMNIFGLNSTEGTGQFWNILVANLSQQMHCMSVHSMFRIG